MKNKTLLTIVSISMLMLGTYFTNGQGMAVNTTSSPADASAILDVKSTTQGMLIPRMLSTQRTGISSPATGLLVYQTDAPEGYYYHSSGGWVMIPAGAASSSIPCADFFALMPGDNSATVAPGTDVQFPQNGPNSGTMSRVSPSAFIMPGIGTYEVMFQVSVNEPGQLELTLNGVALTNTVSGRATGSSQITGIALVNTTLINSILTVRNPASNFIALTITPAAGGTNAVSAHLVITKLQ